MKTPLKCRHMLKIGAFNHIPFQWFEFRFNLVMKCSDNTMPSNIAAGTVDISNTTCTRRVMYHVYPKYSLQKCFKGIKNYSVVLRGRHCSAWNYLDALAQ